MATAILYKISKRENSTLIPTNGTNVNVFIKAGMILTKPVILYSSEEFPDYNMLYWQGRYYYIRDITYVRENLYELVCEEDVLSTYKSEIIGKTAYILYATKNYSPALIDRRIPMIYTKSLKTASVGFLADIFDINGNFLLSAVGENGSVSTFAMNAGDFQRLLDNIQTFQSGFDITLPDPPDFSGGTLSDVSACINYVGDCISTFNDMLNRAVKSFLSFGSCTDAIRACTWLPFNVQGSEAPITLGGYDTGISAKRVGIDVRAEIVNISIPWQFSDWRNAAPFTEVSLYLPFVGNVSLPVSALVGSGTLTIRNALSNKTGEIAIQVKVGETIIGNYGGNSGYSVPVGSSNVSPVAQFNSLFSVGQAAASLAEGNSGAIGGIVSGVEAALTPITQCVGGIGNSAGSVLEPTIICSTICHNTVENPTASVNIRGCPVFASKPIPDSGYVQTSGFEFMSDKAVDAERQKVNGYLNSGIYIE